MSDDTAPPAGRADPPEVTALKALGVHFGQGYYLGRPIPMPDLEAFLDRTPAPS